MMLTQSYEPQRNLLVGMDYHRGNTLVTQRTYSYDSLGRPTTRNTARQGLVMNDTFAHNTRSELVEAQVKDADYEYAYDNVGNRQQATEGNDVTVYDANALNQYTAIGGFEPSYDDAGNQTKVKTSTGIWSAVYNAENRPASFTNSESNTVVECAYDSMGRRATKKVTVNGGVTLHQRFLYRGYLQIACCDLTRSNHPCLWLITWDPLQPVATRPLAIQKDATWYTYGWDLTKNICEVFGPAGYIRTAYTYTPYGENNTSGDVEQFIQWSSEFNDTELGLVYYNYRHYNPIHGRWISRDIIKGKDNANPYVMVYNTPSVLIDKLGKHPGVVVVVGGVAISTAKAVAAVFGLTLSACLLNKECREAVKQALSDLVSTIDEATRNALFATCKYIYQMYNSLKCNKCDKSILMRDCISRKIACAEGVVKLSCFQLKLNYRAAYIASGCDFILEEENWNGHINELRNVANAEAKCATQIAKNCIL